MSHLLKKNLQYLTFPNYSSISLFHSAQFLEVLYSHGLHFHFLLNLFQWDTVLYYVFGNTSPIHLAKSVVISLSSSQTLSCIQCSLPLPLSWNTLLFLKNIFQVYSIIIWYLYILQSDHHHKCNYHPSPYSWPPSPVSLTPPTPFPSGNC